MKKNEDNVLYKIEEEHKIEEEFYYKGFKCIVLLISFTKKEEKLLRGMEFKINTKWRCGYVGVGKKHILYKKNYLDLEQKGYDFKIHGGLTFSNFGGKILPKLPKEYWYFGLDFNHSNDKTSFWTFKKVKNQVKKLARGLQIDSLILQNLK